MSYILLLSHDLPSWKEFTENVHVVRVRKKAVEEPRGRAEDCGAGYQLSRGQRQVTDGTNMPTGPGGHHLLTTNRLYLELKCLPPAEMPTAEWNERQRVKCQRKNY